MVDDLFACHDGDFYRRESLAEGAVLLRGHACDLAAVFLGAIEHIALRSPFRHMETPGGYHMSVEMTNCGSAGWTSDRRGYRYSPVDPLHGRPWPRMPAELMVFARKAAAEAGFDLFSPDVCLINRYAPGARISLHQDKDEADLTAPIVSVSFGLPATFLFGGMKRSDPALRLLLSHGDVMIWGGASRLRFHGILPVKKGIHSAADDYRINFTFRQARR